MSTQAEGPRPAHLLRISEAAARLGVARRTVQGWIAARRLRVVRLSPRCVRVDPADLARFLEEASR
jgi:excisionase family DNA binding protein